MTEKVKKALKRKSANFAKIEKLTIIFIAITTKQTLTNILRIKRITNLAII